MPTNREIGVFVHVEKTAGTTIRRAIEGGVGPEHVFIFSPRADRLARSSDYLMPASTPFLDKLRLALASPIIGPIFVKLWPIAGEFYKYRILQKYPKLNVPEDARVILGHFAAHKFDGLLGLREPITATVIRDPLDRMLSHYQHWKRTRGYEDWRKDQVPFDQTVSFEEFALLPALQNYQSQALAGVDLSSFAVVGVTEHTKEFISAFLQKLTQAGLTLPGQIGGTKVESLNVTPRGRRINFVPNEPFLSAFNQFHAQDFELYHRAQAIQEQRISAGGLL